MTIRSTKLAVAAATTLILLASTVPAASPPPARLSDTVTDAIRAAALEHGLDPDAVLAAEVDVETYAADGTLSVERMTFAQAVLRMTDGVTHQAPGIGGAPEIVAGDFLHIAVKFAVGNARPYSTIKASTTIPSTQPIFVPVVDPTGTLMPMLVYDLGGPTYNVKGSYNVLGVHSAGTVLPAASTAASGPYLPQKDALVIIPDSSIDFVGHASISQTQGCIFGFCLGFAAMLAGAGVAQFDAAPVPVPGVGGVSTAFPILP